MPIYEIITKKKRGEELTDAEIREFVNDFTAGKIPDYQASALLMAICIRGMTERETFTLTDAITNSGDKIDLSEFGQFTADKHSTGGVGDKTTLIVAPIAAAAGCKISKMSGRGLGHTGGTVDKLESIPGYKTDLSAEEFFDTVRRIGIAVAGQSANLAPADKKLYALRDVTATVDSVPLISSSVMSKKLAAGARSIVLDVKYGSGSFMKTPEEAEALAKLMVKLGRLAGRACSALITNMDMPLGYAVGNALEVKEAVDTLKGNGPRDLTEISIALSSEMIYLSLGISKEESQKLASEILYLGKAYEKFKEWISAQGGDISYITDTEKFREAPFCREVIADRDGYIGKTDTEKIGISALTLGAGRKTKSDVIDHAAGIVLERKTGDKVYQGDVIARLYSSKEETLDEAERIFRDASPICENAPVREPLIYNVLSHG